MVPTDPYEAAVRQLRLEIVRFLVTSGRDRYLVRAKEIEEYVLEGKVPEEATK